MRKDVQTLGWRVSGTCKSMDQDPIAVCYYVVCSFNLFVCSVCSVSLVIARRIGTMGTAWLGKATVPHWVQAAVRPTSAAGSGPRCPQCAQVTITMAASLVPFAGNVQLYCRGQGHRAGAGSAGPGDGQHWQSPTHVSALGGGR
jgi:hypothetical protein